MIDHLQSLQYTLNISKFFKFSQLFEEEFWSRDMMEWNRGTQKTQNNNWFSALGNHSQTKLKPEILKKLRQLTVDATNIKDK